MRLGKPLSFLILEPDDYVAELYHNNFNGCLHAATYRSSAEKVHAIPNDFDCIVAEIPPGWTTQKLLQNLRFRWPKTLIVVATSCVKEHVLLDANDHENVAVITKPFNMTELIELIEVSLGIDTEERKERIYRTRIERAN